MSLISFLKGAFKKMTSPKTIQNVLHITPTISSTMKDALEMWEVIYSEHAPWLTENVHSLGLASMIASEKAQLATIEMDYKITGDNNRANFIDKNFKKLIGVIREQLEYGIALGGFVIKPYVVAGVDEKYRIDFNFTKATNFYPLSFSADGKVTEAAFIDRIVKKDTTYSKLEYHKLENNVLTVKNMAFKSMEGANYIQNLGETLGEPIPLTSVDEWANIMPEVSISDMDRMLFEYFRMPLANNIDLNSPLGISGFSKAIDLIKDADEQYSNLLWEFEGGQLAIDVDRTALNPTRDRNGKAIEVLPHLQDRLYRRTLDLGEDNTYKVFSPELRDKSIINGLNNILMHIEDVCALSRGTISTVSYTEARTATELKILKQRSYAANADIQKELERVLLSVLEIMDRYCDLYSIVEPGDFEAAFKWDDSIIVDKDSERQQDLLDVNAGLMSKVEYRMKWYGETEKQANDSLNAIFSEKEKDISLNLLSDGKISSEDTPQERAAKSNKIVDNSKNIP